MNQVELTRSEAFWRIEPHVMRGVPIHALIHLLFFVLFVLFVVNSIH